LVFGTTKGETPEAAISKEERLPQENCGVTADMNFFNVDVATSTPMARRPWVTVR